MPYHSTISQVLFIVQAFKSSLETRIPLTLASVLIMPLVLQGRDTQLEHINNMSLFVLIQMKYRKEIK